MIAVVVRAINAQKSWFYLSKVICFIKTQTLCRTVLAMLVLDVASLPSRQQKYQSIIKLITMILLMYL